MFWSIAWKNVWRNKLRSLLVIMAIALGVAAASYSAALMFGMATQKIKAAVSNEVSHIQLHQADFLENFEIRDSIPQPDQVGAGIAGIPGVKAVTERSVITGMTMSATSSAGIQINAINPDLEKKVTTIYTKISDSSGSYLAVGKRNQVLVSSKIAEKLKVRVKSKIILRFQSADGTIIDGAYKICGIYKTSNGIFDEMNIFINRDDLSRQLGKEAPVHEIAVLLSNNDYLEKVTGTIKKENPALSVLTWKQLQPELGMLTGLLTISLYFLLGIILAALAFGIVNTMLMVVLERVRELGMLMAVGMNKRNLFKMIMLETIFLSLTGGIVGMVISIAVTGITAHSGIDLSSFARGFESMGYDAFIYPELRPDFFIGTVVLVIFTGILSSVYPARMALKINPADAVRGE